MCRIRDSKNSEGSTESGFWFCNHLSKLRLLNLWRFYFYLLKKLFIYFTNYQQKTKTDNFQKLLCVIVKVCMDICSTEASFPREHLILSQRFFNFVIITIRYGLVNINIMMVLKNVWVVPIWKTNRLKTEMGEIWIWGGGVVKKRTWKPFKIKDVNKNNDTKWNNKNKKW